MAEYTDGPTSPLTSANATAGSSSHSSHTTPAFINTDDVRIKYNGDVSMHESVVSTTPVPDTGISDNSGMSTALVMRPKTSMGYDMLGEDMRDMVNTINRLRMKGVEDLGLPLPRIAVIGNQSAGKSSLIEAISGIRVPRYAGTCTRCPLEITLTEDPSVIAPWHCKISLRFHKQYTKKSRGDPWVDIPHHQVHFLNVDDPDHVEAALVRAQLAVLNPSKQWGEYVDIPVYLSGTQNTEVPFSPNVICMEITGHGIPNLSFIDLPGIIHVTERKEEEYLIKLVKCLVESYIKEPDCLVLLAMTMKDDAVNQSAAQMARKFGPNRTIGALTKPDTVLEGEHDQWVKILRGQEHRLQPHGYFVTKQPSQQQLMERIRHAEARLLEEEFFDSNEPWNSELTDLKDRFGTLMLQKYLSKQLANLIRLRLPDIINNVRQQSSQVQAQLDRLPPPPVENLRTVLRRLLDEYFYQIRETIDSRGDNNEFSYQWRKIAERLKSGLIALRPRVNPDETAPRNYNSPFSSRGVGGSFGTFSSNASTPTKGRKRPASSDDLPDDSSDSFNNSPTGPARKKIVVEPRTPAKKVISVEDDDVVETESVAADSSHGNLSKPMHLLEVREVLEVNMTTHIPQTVDPKAVEIISKMHIKLWEGPIQTFINQIDVLLHNHTYKVFAEVFARYEQSPLYTEMKQILDNFHDIVMTKIRTMVTKCHNIESECIFTMQDKEWGRETVYWRQDNIERRRRAVEEQRLLKLQRLQERQNATPGKKQKVELPEREGPDPFQREIDTMINAQSYCAIARKRFGDNVMMRMIRSAFTKFTSHGTFREYIEQELKLHDDEGQVEQRCRELMVEDPHKERLRNQLIAKRLLLDNAWKELEPYQNI